MLTVYSNKEGNYELYTNDWNSTLAPTLEYWSYFLFVFPALALSLSPSGKNLDKAKVFINSKSNHIYWMTIMQKR